MGRSGYITLSVMAAILIVVVLYIVFRDQSVLQKHNETPAAKALLPEAEQSFTTLDGEPTAISDSFGDIMLVSSWASWCPQCTADFSKLGEVAAEFKDKGIVVYAINRGEDTYSAERYLMTIQKPEHVTFILDPSDYFFKNSDGYAMPETIIYNKKGEVVLHQRGELRTEQVKETLRVLTE
jgi:thiol-disulfide isomerase/thioredoxin